MVSLTRQTTTRREKRHQSMGKKRKKGLAASGTPAFPVHPDGYDASAADAKPAADDSEPTTK